MRSRRDFVRRQKDSRQVAQKFARTGRAAWSSLRGIGGRGSAFLYCISSGAPPAEICHGVHRISQCLQVSCAVESQGEERGGLSAGSRRVKPEAVGVLRLGWLCHERLQRTSGRSTEGGASVSCLQYRRSGGVAVCGRAAARKQTLDSGK